MTEQEYQNRIAELEQKWRDDHWVGFVINTFIPCCIGLAVGWWLS